MNIGEYSIEKRTITLVLTFVAAVGGVNAYQGLGRLEDPEFTIKRALVFTSYPGASAEEVDREVTNVIDKKIQELGQIKRLVSRSLRGLSIIEVVIKDKYDKARLPQVWDELRRKVTEVQRELPPGAGPSSVDDDFGDVYGVYVGVTGEGYSYRELKDYVDFLRRELLLVQDVKRITLYGTRPEAIYVAIPRDKRATLGITEQQIFRTLGAKNLAADGGRVRVGAGYPAINPSGQFTTEQQFRDLLISEPGAPELIYLGDVADIHRGYQDPPQQLLRMSYKTVVHDGRVLQPQQVQPLVDAGELDLDDPNLEVVEVQYQPAIGLAISTVQGGNVVTMGEALERRITELEALQPIGIESTVIALQSEAVTKAVNGFMVNLIEAIVIVIVVLLLFMGLKSALIIGFVLYVTIAATFIVMSAWGILLERISLGALIIALGMLVDNAIVVVEGMKLKIEAGEDQRDAARAIVGQQQMPLLGATFVAIIAFAAIGLSQHDTGEYCRSLFQVLLISLLMSWVTAVTITPVLCGMLFKPAAGGSEGADPYGGKLFVVYRRFLELAIRLRFATIGVVFGLFGLALYGFTLLPPGFFPYSTRPQYMVDLWLPQDTHIREVERTAADLAEHIMGFENTKSVATHVGSGGSRFLLVYTPEQPNPSYAQLLVSVFDYAQIDEHIAAVDRWGNENVPDGIVFGKRFKLGPGEGGNIQLRFSGPNRSQLRDLSEEAANMILADPLIKYVRIDWKEPVQVVRPVLARAQARRNGINRPAVANRLEAAFQGIQVGVFREGTREAEDRLIPIVYRAPEEERGDIESLQDLQIYSPAANRMIPLRQIVTDFQTVWEDGLIFRRNRRPTITLHADQVTGEAAIPFARLRPKVEAWFAEQQAKGLPSSYILEWGPEKEDSDEAIAALASSVPLFTILMVLTVIMLFNNLRQPLAIWLTVPLALIGVTVGLLLFDQPFNFMAILGTLALTGMLIKNAIVLIDEINANNERGLEPYEAVVQAGVSRLRPVSMAAATTVLGMIPLLGDIFFVSMALAVMFGLTFATLLTLVIVPTLVATFYRIPSPRAGAPKAVT
ncbi:MAG: efflux RND transporter permease subunit [Myxococcota bacterium]|nr:efflux RND transporter permease subunit [Myxococcota bacterium]